MPPSEFFAPVVQVLGFGYLSGLAFVGLILLTRRGGE